MLLALLPPTKALAEIKTCHSILKRNQSLFRDKISATNYLTPRLKAVFPKLSKEARDVISEVLTMLAHAESERDLSSLHEARYLGSVGAAQLLHQLIFEQFNPVPPNAPEITNSFILRNFKFRKTEKWYELFPDQRIPLDFILSQLQKELQTLSGSDRNLFWQSIAFSSNSPNFGLNVFKTYLSEFQQQSGLYTVAKRLEEGHRLILNDRFDSIEDINVLLLSNNWPAAVISEFAPLDGISKIGPAPVYFHDVDGHFLTYTSILISPNERRAALDVLSKLTDPVDKKVFHLILFEVLHERILSPKDIFDVILLKKPMSARNLFALTSAIRTQLKGPYRSEGYLDLATFDQRIEAVVAAISK